MLGSATPIHQWAPIAVALLVGVTAAFPVKVDRTGDGLIYFGEFTRSGLPAWVILPVIFVAVAAVMAIIADGAARLFPKFEPLTAYRLDILGAVAGILSFALLAWIQTPPVVWGAVAVAILMLALIPEKSLIVIGSAVGLVALLGIVSTSGDIWSPYYRISVAEYDDSYAVGVNGIPHQAIIDIERRVALEPVVSGPLRPLRIGFPRVGPHHRRRQRNRRCHRPRQRCPTRRRRRDRPCPLPSWVRSSTRISRTRTHGSTSPSTTVARSWNAPMNATTSSSTPSPTR